MGYRVYGIYLIWAHMGPAAQGPGPRPGPGPYNCWVLDSEYVVVFVLIFVGFIKNIPQTVFTL